MAVPKLTVPLVLEIKALNGIAHVSWQGDTQALSLTSPIEANSTDGWTVIMPRWSSEAGASNRWHLSLVVEDKTGQRVSSNEIALALTEPLVRLADDGVPWPQLP